VQYGVDEDKKDKSKGLIARFCKEGKIDVVKSLLEREVGINCRNAYNQTPLDRAAERGNLDVVRLLIE
jgi:ankyrin repeat protein